MLAKIIAGCLAIVGAVSAFFAMLSLRRIDKKHAQIELLKARQDAQAKNEKAKEELEEEITKVVEPIQKLTDSKEDREELAALLDE
tara:strand:- start:254 stop:511 length:258 start_codon:yes stop_codon:yes gene_type:complete